MDLTPQIPLSLFSPMAKFQITWIFHSSRCRAWGKVPTTEMGSSHSRMFPGSLFSKPRLTLPLGRELPQGFLTLFTYEQFHLRSRFWRLAQLLMYPTFNALFDNCRYMSILVAFRGSQAFYHWKHIWMPFRYCIKHLRLQPGHVENWIFLQFCWDNVEF